MTIIKSQGVCLKYRVVCCVVNIPKQTLGLGITPETSVHIIHRKMTHLQQHLIFCTLIYIFIIATLYLGSVLSLHDVLLFLLLVFSPWDGLGRDQSSVRRLVWLWYAASWASFQGQLAHCLPPSLCISLLNFHPFCRLPEESRMCRRNMQEVIVYKTSS